MDDHRGLVGKPSSDDFAGSENQRIAIHGASLRNELPGSWSAYLKARATVRDERDRRESAL